MNDDTIIIESFEELNEKMKTMEFSVAWTITSEIGPDWIGSYRTIDFDLDGFVLSETEFVKELKNRLIKLIPIPDKSKTHVITGHGDITIIGNKLEVYYDWEARIPYQDPPDQYKEGKMFFYP